MIKGGYFLILFALAPMLQESALALPTLYPMEATVMTPYLHIYLEPRLDAPILDTHFKGTTLKLTPAAVIKLKNMIIAKEQEDALPLIEMITRIGSIGYVEWQKLEIHFDDATEFEVISSQQ